MDAPTNRGLEALHFGRLTTMAGRPLACRWLEVDWLSERHQVISNYSRWIVAFGLLKLWSCIKKHWFQTYTSATVWLMWELNAAHLTLGNPPKASLAPEPTKASVVRTLLRYLAAQVELFLIESFGAIVSRLPKLTQNLSIWVWPSNRIPFFYLFFWIWDHVECLACCLFQAFFLNLCLWQILSRKTISYNYYQLL